MIVLYLHQAAAAEAAVDVVWLERRRRWHRVPGTARVRLWIRFARLIRQYPGAVLHFHDFETLQPLLWVLRILRWRRRTFLTFHGHEGRCPPDPIIVERRRACARHAVATVAIGRFIARWYGTESTVVSHGGVDLARFAGIVPAATELPQRIAYLGRLEEDTGVLSLIEAAVRARVELNLFGDGSCRGRIERLTRDSATALTLSPPVTDVPRILASHPIVFASGYLSLLEALCARRVVFAYAGSPLREDYLRLHPAAESIRICTSVDEVAAALAECTRDFAGACRRSEPGWRWAREQSWDRLAASYHALWQGTR